MSRLGRLLLASTFALLLGCTAAGAAAAGPPAGPRGYDEFVALFQDFVRDRDALAGDDAVDASAGAVAARVERLHAQQARMDEFAVASWERSRRADWLAARAAMDEHEFLLTVQQPWARDPGYYVDPTLAIAYTELPVPPARLAAFRARLASVATQTAAAQRNLALAIVPAELATLALYNLSNADGVGHGQPYRELPPAGVVGWYDDLLARAQRQQRTLVPDVRRARAAVVGYRQWLQANRARMTAPAGFGAPLFDWYLRHVKYLPYTSAEIELLAQRELERSWALLALERHRNRALPELELPRTSAEYEARLASVDADIRSFLREQEFITVPDFVPPHPQLGFNVPWLVRPAGPNFWEQIQYRDPSPDFWHAVIPGHRYDAVISGRITHPVRRHVEEGSRDEGWALYLEGAALQAGYYELKGRSRARELIHDFAIFRAVRTIGDVRLQHNRAGTKEIAEYWRTWTPYLDADVARVDSEIYLRRPPGYGLGYTIGGFQMEKLLGELRHQLGERFVLRDFHDRFLAAGRLPIALVRYEMTGNDDEVKRFWERVPLRAVLQEQARAH